MKVMIHACPARMWYVEGILVPDLTAHGVTEVIVWNDSARLGNLQSCMAAFASCTGDGGTWHIQDDVLLASDFAERAEQFDGGDQVVCGFCTEIYGPDVNIKGRVYMADMWNSFQCIYIPDKIARECAAWFHMGLWKTEAGPESFAQFEANMGDDWFFRQFMEIRHGRETAINLTPNLADHIDWLVGGSIVNQYRGHLTRAAYFDDEDRVTELKQRIKAIRNR